MPASPEKIREVIEQYVARVATGTTDQVLDLFAEGATVEDPVGGEVLSARIAGGEAAFLFELRTKAGEQTYTLAPIDVMTFDDDGKITSMRAFWDPAEMRPAED